MLTFFNNWIFGPLLPLVLMAAGLYFLIRLRGFLIRHPIRVLRGMAGDPAKRGQSFRAACVALSGTLGVGNIAGVAAAILTGGAGAVFWMWVFAFFAMVIKYVEVVAAMCYRRNGHGGVAYYIEGGLHSRSLGCAMAILVLISSFGIGNVVQSAAAAEALKGSFEVPKWVTGVVFAVVGYLLLRGGVQRVTRFSSIVVPLLSLGYLVLSLAILIRHYDRIPYVMGRILSDAFAPGAVIGGGGGFLIGRALRYGAARGILSNEAGCGTAAYAHASADNTPAVQGFWGIFEVFVDTVLLCSLTAFVVLVTDPTASDGNGMALALRAYASLGDGGGDFIAVSSAVYALASVVCWSYYGTESLTYLGWGEKAKGVYLLLYSATGILGAVAAPAFVWDVSDATVSLMALCNTACLIRLIPEVEKETKRYFSRQKKQKSPAE